MTEATDLLEGPVAHLVPVGLEELVERAGLLTRVDRKYLVPVADVGALVRGLPRDAQVLQIGTRRLFDYESVYFDTPDLLAYHLAAHRRRRRFKVRTRTYVDSAQCWIEVKTRGTRGTTIKDRVPHRLDDRADVAPALPFVTATLGAHGITGAADLRWSPTLVTRYRRATILLPEAGSRLTVDLELAWHDRRRPLHLRDLAVVETKTGSTASAADRLLWALGHRPLRISKYATGLAALQPELPATRWRRTLRRHLVPHSVSAVEASAH
ncbi:polyphosphate polymerase domain-containing protein [Cellulomonas phragmiteti]|uniref:VTC domain-containing protein n=1 Tax=Cellulomonas phragmiteti TaxID=478780 RepID=A0ABQ4DGQ9_9CELL|nr:polyphosphate polymerase domain-containing protein [Cellulomonas phragmiteti]GIG38531.1 VTC domain-containing protein [Cellulomonas phragmiteti]